MRISRIVVAALINAIVLLAPPGATAGTAEAPEIVDPAGDAKDITLLGTAPAADITSVWFETVRDDEGAVRALEVHLTTVEPVAEGGGAGFTVFWDAWAGAEGESASCWSELSWDLVPEEYGGTWHGLFLNCDDGEPISLEDILNLDIINPAETHQTGLRADGTHYALQIDLTAFPEEAAVLHEEGDALTGIFAYSRDFNDDAVIGIGGGLCTDVAPANGCWLGAFAVPDTTATYVIGT